MTLRWFGSLLLLLAGALGVWASVEPVSAPEGGHVKVLRGEDAFFYSPDGTRVATVTFDEEGKRVRLEIDGKSSDWYTDVLSESISFSPDGTVLCYAIRADGVFRGDPMSKAMKEVLVRNGVLGDFVDQVRLITYSPGTLKPTYRVRMGERIYVFNEAPPAPSLTADVSRLAYLTGTSKKWTLMLDGTPFKAGEGAKSITFSPDGLHYAAICTLKGRQYVLCDGREGAKYEKIYGVRFSPDSSRVAYVASALGMYLVLCGSSGSALLPLRIAPCKQVEIDSLVFSADSKHVAFISTEDDQGRQRVVLDGKVGKVYTRVATGSLLFSPDSTRLCYIAQQDKSQYLVCNEVAGPAWLAVGVARFSRDGKHLAYAAQNTEKQWCIVRDGKAGPAYSWVGAPTFSRDGLHLAYAATTEDGECLVLDGTPGPPTAGIGHFFLHPDGTRAVYSAKTAEGWQVRLGEKTLGGTYTEILEPGPRFSPDGTRTAFLAKRVFPPAKEGEEPVTRYYAVVDSVESPAWSGAADLLFSPDSRAVAYAALREGQWRVVRDNTPGEPWDGIQALRFSPKGTRLSYVGARGMQRVPVLDTTPGAVYDGVRLTGFDPEDKHVVSVARRGDKEVLLLDGTEFGPWDSIRVGPFSLKSKHLAYATLENGRWTLRLSGLEKKSLAYPAILTAAFRADGTALDLTARRLDGTSVAESIALEPPKEEE